MLIASMGTGRAAVAAGGWAGGEHAGEVRTLVVMSYNIHHGSGNRPCIPPAAVTPPSADCALDLDQIAAIIRTENPDIVGVQELDRFWGRSGMVDQPAYLARSLGMHLCYAPNLDHGPDEHSGVAHQYGTAILSRYPISQCTHTLLPHATESAEQRGLQAAKVNVAGVSQVFLNTHLHLTPADRALQVAAIVKAIGLEKAPAILVGDFNAQPGEASLGPLLDMMTDAWAAAGEGAGYTIPAQPGRAPRRRIDYVFVWRNLKVRSVSVVQHEETAMASDHYPVKATIEIQP